MLARGTRRDDIPRACTVACLLTIWTSFSISPVGQRYQTWQVRKSHQFEVEGTMNTAELVERVATEQNPNKVIEATVMVRQKPGIGVKS